MKFIGQYIQSLIARFRNDVYLDNVESGSVNSGDHLGVDAYGKIVKTTGGGGSNIKKVDDNTAPASVSDFDGKDFYLANHPNNSASLQRLFVINNEEDGIFYEDLNRWVALTFNLSTPTFSGQTNTNGKYVIGSSSSIWLQNDPGIDCNYNSIHSNGLDSNATNTIQIINKSTNQAGGSLTTITNSDITQGGELTGLVNYRFGETSADFDIYYPNDSTWQTNLGYKSLAIQVVANDQSSTAQQIKTGTYKFYNKKYYGFNANSSITGNQIITLFNDWADNQDSIGISETTINPNNTMKYIYYCYPCRYGDGQTGNTTNTARPGTGSSCVLSWKINTLPVTGGFDHLTPSINVTGASYFNDPTITHNSISGITAGMAVFGDGIPENATVASVTSNTEFELSVSTTGNQKTNQNIFVGNKIAVTNTANYTEFYEVYRSPQQYDAETSFEVIKS
jgi:hypothetical protein